MKTKLGALLICTAVLTLFFGAYVWAESKEVKIIRQFAGQYPSQLTIHSTSESPHPPRIVRTQSELEDFLERIPQFVTSKISPPPKNDDPIKKPGAIELSKNMLLVVFNVHSGASPHFEEVYSNDDRKLHARYAEFAPDACTMCADELSTGSYAAIVLKKSSLPVEFEKIELNRNEGAK